jgi:hypothetical protein
MRQVGSTLGEEHRRGARRGNRGPRILQDTDHFRRYDEITNALSDVLEQSRLDLVRATPL